MFLMRFYHTIVRCAHIKCILLPIAIASTCYETSTCIISYSYGLRAQLRRFYFVGVLTSSFKKCGFKIILTEFVFNMLYLINYLSIEILIYWIYKWLIIYIYVEILILSRYLKLIFPRKYSHKPYRVLSRPTLRNP